MVSTVVQIASGLVRGVSEQSLAVFRGIPFASLPARFAAPSPVEAWDGEREATRFGPPPPQSALFGTDALIADGDEWLTVNVWSPDLGGGLPVMVWIQGGGYMFGASGLPEYDASNLARRGVVVVTFNYRVGVEGFASIPGTPPNRGLLDQVAALAWVRDNVSSFGGDPSRVTIFGQSAGAGSVAALLAMPLAEGLFHRAIAQSLPGAYFTPALAEDIARTLADELGVEPADMVGVEPEMLVVAGDSVLEGSARHTDRWGRAGYAQIPFAPVVDGDVLPSTPWQGLSGRIELMVGHTRDEQRLLSVVSGVRGEVSDAQALEAAEVLGPDPQRYREAFPDPEELYEVVRSDWLFRMPSLHLAEAQLRAGGSAHFYELAWPAPGMGGIFGACHGLDVPLVFGNLGLGQPAMLIGAVPPEAEALSEQMQSAWIAFATSGDPGWPAYDTGSTRVFDVEPTVGDYPHLLSRQIWSDPPALLDLRESRTAS